MAGLCSYSEHFHEWRCPIILFRACRPLDYVDYYLYCTEYRPNIGLGLLQGKAIFLLVLIMVLIHHGQFALVTCYVPFSPQDGTPTCNENGGAQTVAENLCLVISEPVKSSLVIFSYGENTCNAIHWLLWPLTL